MHAGQVHPAVYLLVDHLDAALALGEDLLTEKIAFIGPSQPLTHARLEKQNGDVSAFVGRVRTLELALTARVLQARRRADELKRDQVSLRPLIALFVASTAQLLEAAAELGDPTAHQFNTGDVALSFLRSRAIIARDTSGLDRLPGVAVSEDYLVAARIRLGTLLDLVATFLDALDLVCQLYPDAAVPDTLSDKLVGRAD